MSLYDEVSKIQTIQQSVDLNQCDLNVVIRSIGIEIQYSIMFIKSSTFSSWKI